jgi:hypothetical protein
VQGGNARINNAFIGDVGHGSTWTGFSNSSSANTTGYAVLQSTSGDFTLINKQNTGSGYIGFRVANADMAVITNAGDMGIGTIGPGSKLDVVGRVDARNGMRARKTIYFFQRFKYCNCYGAGATTIDIGNFDFCAVAQVGFKNNQSSSDEDDDVQCVVWPIDASAGAPGEQTNFTTTLTYGYTARPFWRMYFEAFEDTNGVTCAANCINFE